MSATPLELSSNEILTIVNSLLASTHLDSVAQSESFGLALKLQAALPSSYFGSSQLAPPVTINVIQSLPEDQSQVQTYADFNLFLLSDTCYYLSEYRSSWHSE